MARYRDSYPVFGNAWVMCGFLTWDFYINHVGSRAAVHAEQAHRLRLHEARRRVTWIASSNLNINMHKLFREWHELERKPRDPDMLATFPVLSRGLVGLVKEYPDEEALLEELRANVRNSEAMAVAIFNQAAQALPEGPPADRPINPYALSLDPKRWEADGLFEDAGHDDRAGPRDGHRGLDGMWDSSLAFAGGPPPGVGGPPAGVGGPPPGVGGPPPGAGGPPA